MKLPKAIPLSQLAKELKLPFSGEGDTPLTHACGLDELKDGGLAYISNPKQLANLPTPKGVFSSEGKEVETLGNFKGAVILPEGSEALGYNALFSKDPLASHCQAMTILHPAPPASKSVHPSASLAEGVKLGKGVTIDAHVVIYEGCEIGANSIVRAGSILMQNVLVGKNSLIYPNVTIREESQIGDSVIIHAGAVIGSDGYGYFQRPGKQDCYESTKIPQVGRVIIEDEVEIGSCCCIDRARFSETIIQRGCKLDNLIHIAHNVVVGHDSLITAQSGIAGSTTTGPNLMMGGQSGMRDNLTLGKGVKLLARTLVTANAQDKEELAGMPGRPMREWRRTEALIHGLGGLMDRLKDLERFAKSVGFKKK